ncbi:MAG: hypothetical protein Kow0080_14830 [Candidatus Promineifilaceae bacterium]
MYLFSDSLPQPGSRHLYTNKSAASNGRFPHRARHRKHNGRSCHCHCHRPPPIPDATYGENNGIKYAQIPTTDCANLTATPIIVNDWLIYPMHEHSQGCETHSDYQHTLFGYNLSDGQLYQLYDGAAGEASLLYAPEQNLLYWTTTFGSTFRLIDAATLTMQTQGGAGTTSDSGGTMLNGLYYFGTVNTPYDICQNPINPNCGALFAIDSSGNIVHQLNTDDGFRAWVGTSITTDGQYLYVGSAKQTMGEPEVENEYLHGCSVTKLDAELNVLATFDPGDPSCYYQPFQGANADSVSGEIVPDGSGLWVQYVRPNDSELKTALYRLDLNLQEQCRVEFPFEPQTQAVGFYGAPTVDKDGIAYVVVTVPDTQNTQRGQLWQVTPECQATLLAEVPGSWAHASPTLADDQYVLFVTDGRLQILTLDGQLVQDYTLASTARVNASPVIHNGVIYVVQEDGTVNIIENSGISGYGSAIWPRYRHDNEGSAALGNTTTSETTTFLPVVTVTPAAETADQTETAVSPKGTFIAFHLEVSRGPRIKTLWPKLEQFMALADQYGVKVTLQFSAPWADYVYKSGLLDTVYAWEANGHEIALHHHGPTHKFFDGYTNNPDAIRTDGWYATDYGYLGSMDDLMTFMAPLSQKDITSAGMSDEETDWPAGVLYFATDSGETPSKDDLLSTPVETTHNGYPVVEIYNAGYLIGHLGDAAVDLNDIEHALQTAVPDEYIGIVFNDETIEQDFAQIEPLFQLFQQYGVQVETVSSLMAAR